MKIRKVLPVLGFSLFLLLLFKLFPVLMDTVYSSFLYRYVAQGVSVIMAFFPFSLAEVVLFLTVFFLLFFLVKAVVLLIRLPFAQVWVRWKVWLRNLLVLLLYGVSVFLLTCGVHYHRVPLENHLGYPKEQASAEELAALAFDLVQEVNLAGSYTRRNIEGDMVPNETFDGYKKAIALAYDSLAVTSGLAVHGRFPATKQVFVSKGMSYAFLSGFFFPWTLEANINKDVPIFRMPAIMAHEQAHVRGFMRENEANFLTYLIARHTRNGDLKYSCLLLSFNYVMNALYKASKEQHREVLEKLSPRVLHDLRSEQAYWEKYRTSFAVASQKINNAYLKANAQHDGVASYGRVIDMMVSEHKMHRKEMQQNQDTSVHIVEGI